eukprot:1139049-Pelagomonas_calceolata.AAC.6
MCPVHSQAADVPYLLKGAHMLCCVLPHTKRKTASPLSCPVKIKAVQVIPFLSLLQVLEHRGLGLEDLPQHQVAHLLDSKWTPRAAQAPTVCHLLGCQLGSYVVIVGIQQATRRVTCSASGAVHMHAACRYNLRVLFGAIDMRWDWPVDANYHEAKAFCAWRAEQDKSPVM